MTTPTSSTTNVFIAPTISSSKTEPITTTTESMPSISIETINSSGSTTPSTIMSITESTTITLNESTTTSTTTNPTIMTTTTASTTTEFIAPSTTEFTPSTSTEITKAKHVVPESTTPMTTSAITATKTIDPEMPQVSPHQCSEFEDFSCVPHTMCKTNNFTIRSLDISMIEGVKPENAECTEKDFSCCHKNDTIPISITPSTNDTIPISITPSTTSSTLESIDSTTITEHNIN